MNDMDIFEFVEGIGPAPSASIPEKMARLAVLAGLAPDFVELPLYLKEAASVQLPGDAFDHYFTHLFSPHFAFSGGGFVRHCILNFAVMQLFSSARIFPMRERYLFAGGISETDFAASMFAAASWLLAFLVDSGGREGHQASPARELLTRNKEDEAGAFHVIDNDFLDFLRDEPPGTFALISLISVDNMIFNQENLSVILDSMAGNGTALISMPADAGAARPASSLISRSLTYRFDSEHVSPFKGDALCIIRRSERADI